MFEAILLTNAAATLYMVGLIWMVQRVHYPLFDGVSEPQFAAYEARHTRAITPIVLPPMMVELVSAVGLVIVKPDAELGLVLPGWMPWVGLGLVLLVWGVTFCCSVPQHVKLARGFDPKACRLLVNTNWLRTAGWTLRGGLVIWMLALVMRG
ncbi:hypothetical protein [Algisphaera agarilytica]|uniref:Putative membrane protein n=1 Tax=Algisphaera agarilytica TaxID=1385975 RepID=A0A7X0LN49_9BACT|nr:hypothetical protein [Algisphaera agarilytica]MBB6431658.1 putative membrane protein [Algisphaera agarilytica]